VKLVESLYEDMRATLETRLVGEGFDYAGERGKAEKAALKNGTRFDAPHWTLTRFLDQSRRRIPQAVRQCVWSAELRQRTLTTDLQGPVEDIVKASEAGDDLRPFQSTRVENLGFNDMLLNDWGVQHLHLGLGPHPKRPGFVGRRDELLFVLVRPEVLYLIDVLDHESFSKMQLVEIVHGNWPALIAYARPVGVVDLAGPERTDEGYGQMRDAGFNMMVKTKDGTIYAGIGGGYSLSGVSGAAVHRANSIMNRMRMVAEQAERDSAEFVAYVQKVTGTRPAALKLRLIESQPTWVVTDGPTGTKLIDTGIDL
jgi:hypothetical protein